MHDRVTPDAVTPTNRWLDDGYELMLERVISESALDAPPPAVRFPLWLETNGLVDLQVNGFAGVDFNDSEITPQALDHALQAMLATGVTLCLPTLITAESGLMLERMKALDAAVSSSQLGPLMVPGFHVEGPFLNATAGYAGCHPPMAMDISDISLMSRLRAATSGRPILLTTLAPEHPVSSRLIRETRAAGSLVAVSHSNADYHQIQCAADAGVTMSTHLGNGLPKMLPKLDNTLFAQLAEDRLSASFIADGIHIPPFALRVLLKAKGISRSMLVSDAVSAAASPAGTYSFAGRQIERSTDGSVSQPGEAHLAGSSLCLDQAIRNLVRWDICSPLTALRLACHNPMSMLKPALEAFRIPLVPSRVIWSDQLEVIEASVGKWRWRR